MHEVTEGDKLAFMADVAYKIDKYGFQVTGVFGTPESPISPFSYTTGLEPELIAAGIDAKAAQGLFIASTHLNEHDEVVEEGLVTMHLLSNGMRCKFVAVPRHYKEELMTVTRQWRRDNDWAALQIVWPDPEGRLPGEPDFDERYGKAQELEFCL